jgi:hypothetical protein
MIRIKHTQTTPGTILLADIDDGLRFKYKINTDNSRSIALKQPVYVDYVNVNDVTQPGYVDLVDSDKVLLSLDHGTLHGLVAGGFVTATAFAQTALVTPVIAAAQVGVPAGGDLTITAASGKTFLSILPDTSYLTITGTGAIVLTRAQVIVPVGGIWTATSIVVKSALFTVPIAATTSFAKVTANKKDSNVFTVTL